ncbi:MAG: group II intron reverse transcriptase/maturase [Marinobacter alexandrii]|uniref:group II intron reverse transcriptase/maturase n=1 Tax=Marinobacter alexandrii TaxID=2570351 RepID=UPI00329A3F18
MIEQVVRRKNLLKARRQVERNQGSSGVDGMPVSQLKQHLDQTRDALVTSILNHSYTAQPILGVVIPKGEGNLPSGKAGTRLLGVPTVIDRVLQQAVSQVLAPKFELEFKDHSYGFRPQKNAHQAVLQAQKYIHEGYEHIVDIDLKNFFDEVEHYIILQLIYRKVKCPTTLRLIRVWLRAPMQIGGKLTKRRKGMPQGSPLSPLLSNVMLHELDRELEKRGMKYVRYADDFSIYTKTKSEARKIGNSIYEFLRDKLKLPINREKSGLRKPVQFQVLGFGFVPTYQKGERGKYQLVVGKKGWRKLKQTLKMITRKTVPMSLQERFLKLKEVQRGWLNYFRMASIQAKLKEIDSWIRNRLRYCIWHDWKKLERKRKNLIRLGIPYGQAYAWSRTRMGGWAVAQSPILRTTITLDRLRKRGYQSLSEHYSIVSPLLNEPPYTRPVRTVV